MKFTQGKESQTSQWHLWEPETDVPEAAALVPSSPNSMGRRDCLKAVAAQIGVGAGLCLLNGCVTSSSQLALHRPEPNWPDTNVSTHPMGQQISGLNPPVRKLTPTFKSVISRHYWTKSSPVNARINPMNGISRITIHHEGATPVHFSDRSMTARRLESIRRGHLGRKWGDIGYHYVVDRSGRIWQGRNIHSQGAHVRDHNAHNLGVMVLGNFEKQYPSDAQLAGLQQALKQFKHRYRVPSSKIYTHREFVATACPGRYLQSQISRIRTSL